MVMTSVREIVPHVPEGLEMGLRNYWYPILRSDALGADKPVAVTCLGDNLVAWRDRDGAPQVVHDRCPHRGARLSIGRVLEGQLQCIFHGLRFDGAGRCVLIPWEPEDSPLRANASVIGYPARELAGYVWAYLGDVERFPPPPLESEVPAELTDSEHFLWFHLPTDVWDTNWLVAIDGSDALHAVTLHADTQAVVDRQWEGGHVERPAVPLEDRRIKVVDGAHGIRAISTDREGTPIHHGHLTDVKGDRFVLPCLTSNPIRPVPNVEPYVARLWQFPVDANRTWIMRYTVQRVRSDADRERWAQVFHDVVSPRLMGVAAEDAMIAAAQGDLVAARSREHLFAADRDVLRVRLLLKRAFLAQRNGDRVAPTPESLVYPV
jgi:phenylpropionate dioxygenase-like ring-hydroxylating dioxygenase large terminal subunit